MNESLPPEGRRVSYKSLDSEAMAAARRAAEAAGISLQEWLSRTILENARRAGIVPEDPSRTVAPQPPQGSAEEAVQAIARHLERAKSAADQQGLSLADWLSRAILTNAAEVGPSRRLRMEQPPPPRPELSVTPRSDLRGDNGRADSGRHGREFPVSPPRFRARPHDPDGESDLPAASSVRDVLSRSGPGAAPPPPAAEDTPRRRRTGPLWGMLSILIVIAGGIWALPYVAGNRGGEARVPAPPAGETGRSGHAALPGDAKPADAKPGKAKPGDAKAGEAKPGDAKPAEAKPAEPRAAEAKPPAAPPPGGEPDRAAKPGDDAGSLPDAGKPSDRADASPGTPPAKAGEPPAERRTADAKPADAKPADAKPADAKPAERKAAEPPAAEAKPQGRPLPDTAETDLARVAAKDMPKPASAHPDWYRKAADAGNPEAQYALAELYLKGDGVKQDFKAAAQLFRSAAERGNLARAQYALGLLFQRGLGVTKSDVEAVLWWQKAADQNFMPAVTWVGLSLLEGKGIQKDEVAARRMLERAAEGDEPNAQYTLGRIYEVGIGTNRDMVAAMKWFILAAEQAHPQATQKVEELSTKLPRDVQERATQEVSEHYRRFRKRS